MFADRWMSFMWERVERMDERDWKRREEEEEVGEEESFGGA